MRMRTKWQKGVLLGAIGLSAGLVVVLMAGISSAAPAPAAMAGSGGGWRWYTETIDMAGTWGYYHSIAIVPEEPYTICAAYRLIVGGDELKYGWRTSSGWVSETVESVGDAADTGGFVSLALAPVAPYTPHVSYQTYSLSPPFGLWFGRRAGGTWYTETVDSGYDVGEWSSLALAPTAPYTPHIAYSSGPPDRELRYARELAGGGWDQTLVDDTLDELMGVSLALMPTPPYTPHVSYAAWRTGDGDRYLQHAWLSESGWVSETVDGRNPVGMITSLGIVPTPPYTLHIAYRSETTLRHAWLTPSGWLSETVDATSDPAGGYPSLAVEPVPPYRLHIAYETVAAKGYQLEHAWGTSGSWSTEEVAGWRAYPYPSLALEPVWPYAPHILYRQAGKYVGQAWGGLREVYLPAVLRQ
jgi:hypothetical protein